MTIHGDLLIRGGRVIDPASDFSGVADVLIEKGKILAIANDGKLQAAKTIDAAGHLVLPGLIDYHTHIFHGGTEIGISPDSALLPQGVTTAVDQGSAGVANLDSFFRSVVANSQLRIFSYLHASPAGLATLPRFLEPVDPKTFNLESAISCFQKYPQQLVGLKIRQSAEIVGDWGLAPLKATVQMAEAIGCRVVVHTTNPPGDVAELVSLLRPGDVFTHVYQGKGSTILGADETVRQEIRQARTRGVLFDTADGRGHYTFPVARAAIADGFSPDIISTDIVSGSLFDRSVFGLPLIMSKYLALGLAVDDVVRACTSKPAQLLGMAGRLGTLAPGAFADVAVFQLKEQAVELQDVFDNQLHCPRILVPRMTVLNGRIVYRSLEF